MVNAMTIDVEDYFQVSAFDGLISRADWHHYESRVSRNTERLLAILDEAGVKATFFVLGWVAERYPQLVRRIACSGHEIASHGYEHRLVYNMSRDEFADDLRRARLVLEDAVGAAVSGYRAPSYSITRCSMWALDVLLEQGYLYDASIFPVYHDRYGIPDAPRHLHQIERSAGLIWELPGATVRWAGQNLPIGGGGYFRLLPYSWTRFGIAHVNRVEGKAVVFYLHPWEIDAAQPRMRAAWLARVRHYTNLSRTETRLRRLLSDFKFGTVGDVLLGQSAAELSAPRVPSLALA
jgi:polysaccharide deacetylase family protein (PEP-CTERM system associated)